MRRPAAAALVLRCEGAHTPGLTTAAVSVALTKREREIVGLAAAGASSNVIADHLFLSVRTVNNHLQRAYIKLGVSNRSELRAASGPRRRPIDDLNVGQRAQRSN